MKIQVLVAALKQEPEKLIEKMKLSCDAVVVNQCDYDKEALIKYDNHAIHVIEYCGRGVGNNRNKALEHADSDTDVILFSDEDIVYHEGFAKKIEAAFQENPKADMLLFNMKVNPARATYHIDRKTRIRWYNSGRYPTYSFAIRLKPLREKKITFSPLFGGGAKYSNGEDSLFLKDCLRNHFRIYALPIEIGEEVFRESTWFEGYTEKFFFDRGVLYHFLYRNLAGLFAWVFILRKKKVMCCEIPPKQALALIKRGILQGSKEGNV